MVAPPTNTPPNHHQTTAKPPPNHRQTRSVLQERRDQPVSWMVQSQLVKGEKTRRRIWLCSSSVLDFSLSCVKRLVGNKFFDGEVKCQTEMATYVLFTVHTHRHRRRRRTLIFYSIDIQFIVYTLLLIMYKDTIYIFCSLANTHTCIVSV